VVGLADAFDAMTSDRPYRKGMSASAAFAEIEKMSGKQFDPVFAGAFLALRDELQLEMQTQAAAVHSTRRLRAVTV
jgi:HD-GYP domain-containing protein (c-di-GMP phosphodiesterase class II)